MGRTIYRKSVSVQPIVKACCTNCGRVENIDLLDGGGPDFGKEPNALECIACYGPGWLPMASIDAHPSVCPDLAPLYQRHRTETEGEQNG